MPHAAEKPIPRLHPVAEISTYSEADAIAIVTANYQRLRAEVDRLKEMVTRIANRESVHHDVRASHGRAHSYSQDDRAKSISDLNQEPHRRRG